MNDILDKFRSRIAAARNELDSVQSDYNSLIQGVISFQTDYSFVKSEGKKSELEALSRQMNLHLNGVFTGSARERFDSICRLAHKQMEGSLKYLFYTTHNTEKSDSKALNAFVADYNSKAPSSWTPINPSNWRNVKFYQLITYLNFIEPDSQWLAGSEILNSYRNTLSHFGYFEEIEKASKRDINFKKFASERPYLFVLDLLDETLFKVEFKLEQLKPKT